MLLYVVKCANVYFRILHYEGLWLDPQTCSVAGQACHEMTDTWPTIERIQGCFVLGVIKGVGDRATYMYVSEAGYMCLAKGTWVRGWSLFRSRPKVHMQEHFSLHDCNDTYTIGAGSAGWLCTMCRCFVEDSAP